MEAQSAAKNSIFEGTPLEQTKGTRTPRTRDPILSSRAGMVVGGWMNKDEGQGKRTPFCLNELWPLAREWLVGVVPVAFLLKVGALTYLHSVSFIAQEKGTRLLLRNVPQVSGSGTGSLTIGVGERTIICLLQ